MALVAVAMAGCGAAARSPLRPRFVHGVVLAPARIVTVGAAAAPSQGADVLLVRYDPRTQHVFIAHADRYFAVIDAKTYAVRTDLALPGMPEAFWIVKGQPRAYVNVPSQNQVLVVDTSKDGDLAGTHADAAEMRNAAAHADIEAVRIGVPDEVDG